MADVWGPKGARPVQEDGLDAQKMFLWGPKGARPVRKIAMLIV